MGLITLIEDISLKLIFVNQTPAKYCFTLYTFSFELN
jgi:hypothetical protein